MRISSIIERIIAQTRRKILDSCAPRTFIPAQSQHQFFSFREEGMVNPVLCIRFAVKCCALNKYSVERRVVVDVPDRGCFSGNW